MHRTRNPYYMKKLFAAILFLALFSCNSNINTHVNVTNDTSTISRAIAPKDTVINGSPAEAEIETGTYYLVEVASGHNFDSLKNISLNAVSILNSRFDMLNRIYKQGKGIIVPESSDDEIYRGEYYPRRPFEDQNFVSIEMLSALNNKEEDTLEMVSLAGMYTLKDQADSVALLLKDKIPSTRITKRELYLGCMH